jgi:hypothetical protein
MKVAELIGAELDAWVALAEGVCVVMHQGRPCLESEFDPEGPANWFDASAWKMWLIYQPSTNPAQGQPIMERERIGVQWGSNQEQFPGWGATIGPVHYGEEAVAFGPTQLIAGCRARVAQVYGEEVPE